MESIKNLIKFIRNHIKVPYFCKVNLYKKQELIDDSIFENKFFERKVQINSISKDDIVNGRLTILIPDEIIKDILEVMLISE
ncbi:MAG: hypothetical protein ABWZ79_16745 [Pedobacter agri]